MKKGDIVIYQVSDADSEIIKHNHVSELPAIVVQVWTDITVNLKVFCDGPNDAWKTSVMRGDEPGQWYIPGD